MHTKLKMTVLMAGLLGLQAIALNAEAAKKYVPGRIIVANRTSGTLSIIDEKTGQLLKNVPVAGKYSFARPPEPMYVNYVAKLNQLLVNDRTNNQVIALDANDYHLINTVAINSEEVPVAGAFHMWTDGLGKQTWAVGDVAKNITVIDPKALTVLTQFAIPGDLSSGKPHDVLLDKKAKYAFTTIIGVDGANDYVVQYNPKTFKEVARFATGKDPHVGILNSGKPLFVPTQESSKVYVLDPTPAKKLADLSQGGIDVPNAHGVSWTPDGKYLFVGNHSKPVDNKNGEAVLYVIDTKTLQVVNSAVLPEQVLTDNPGLNTLIVHNITVNGDGSKLYLTHSGHDEGTQVGLLTIWDIDPASGALTYSDVATVGVNPFGITYVPGK